MRHIVCAALVLAGAVVMTWEAYVYGNTSNLAYAVILAATSVGLFQRYAWAPYFVYAFTALTIVGWSVETTVALWKGAGNGPALAVIVALFPGIAWCVYWLAVSWTAYQAVRAPTSSG